VNLRIGAAASSEVSTDRPTICLEGAPLRRLSLEMCGTGSGFLHRDPTPQLMHTRANWVLHEWQSAGIWVRPRLGAGFAELQIGEDSPGFHFFGTDPQGVETSGPEAHFSLQFLYPMGQGLNIVSEMHAGMAYLHFAPNLVYAMNRHQPYAGLTFGFGW
jgi:hypothetical protein